MNLDGLVQSVPEYEISLRDGLARWIDDWKRGTESLEHLSHLVTKWHGNVWFQKAEDSNVFFRNWSTFKTEAIYAIGAMSLSERLYAFGLLELWSESDEEYRDRLLAKLKFTTKPPSRTSA